MERHQVVLASARDLDVLHEHHLVVPLVEHDADNLVRVLVQAREGLGECARDATGSARQAFAFRIFADRLEDLADSPFDARQVESRTHRRNVGA